MQDEHIRLRLYFFEAYITYFRNIGGITCQRDDTTSEHGELPRRLAADPAEPNNSYREVTNPFQTVCFGLPDPQLCPPVEPGDSPHMCKHQSNCMVRNLCGAVIGNVCDVSAAQRRLLYRNVVDPHTHTCNNRQ